MAIQQQISGLFSRIQSFVDDYLVTPSAREQYYNNINAFAHKKPLVFTFLLPQLLLSLTPILIFLSFALGVLLISLVSALLFSLFWIGVALLVLIPTLFITVSLAIVVWVWAISSFSIARWVYNAVLGEVGKEGQVVVNGKGEGTG